MVKLMRLLVDGHLHVYDCYNLEKFFQNAIANLESAARLNFPDDEQRQNIFLLTEGKENRFFKTFKETGTLPNQRDFRFLDTGESCSLMLTRDGKTAGYVLNGRQIVTRENLEVLHVATDTYIPDGEPIQQVVESIISNNQIAILAWGVGKWMFQRGKIISDLIRNYQSPYLFIGDNSARPVLFPTPGLYKTARQKGIRLLNGSDPLPFAGEESKPGSFGFSVKGRFDPQKPAHSLKQILTNPDSAIEFFGQRDRCASFFSRQSKIYLKKYLGKK